MTTGFAVHERYMWHDTGSATLFFPSGGFIGPARHSEGPETKRRFRGLVEATGLIDHLTPLAPAPVTEDDLLRYHTQEYVDKTKAYSAGGCLDPQRRQGSQARGGHQSRHRLRERNRRRGALGGLQVERMGPRDGQASDRPQYGGQERLDAALLNGNTADATAPIPEVYR